MSRYDLYVTRQSADATLSALARISVRCIPVFNPAQQNYTETVASAVTAVRVKPTVNDVHVLLLFNGKAVVPERHRKPLPFTNRRQYDQHGGNGRVRQYAT